jgi:hypothetical protein
MRLFFSGSTCRIFFILPLLLSPLLSSCLYEMPDDDHLHEIPTTNNPCVTRETTKMNMPI